MSLPIVNGRRFGWKRSPRSHKSFGLASVPGLKLVQPPPVDVHLEQFQQPVKDQGNLGACTAFCGAEDREATAAQYEHKIVKLSPLFLYYLERQLNGTLDQGDCGSDGETSCQVLNQYGICPESADPYNPSQVQVAPTPQQLQAALPFKDGAYHSLYTVEDIKLCIVSGYRIRIGSDVYQSFEETGSNGLVPVPDPTRESLLGGHEYLAFGYDDTVKCPGATTPGAIKCQNSWGTSWGLAGKFWLAYEAIPIIEADFKIQHLGRAWAPPLVP